ncbi:MAG: 5-deoxy-glucuronate isomerase [Deltaproteobacteria bacterium]|nr:5-deoxy-glucuronate isomerase [Deltaproteobacteria bacterium]MBZ0219236.1 5-deoxy-glucuronate isomerase [Deltaproteobacteria bacterium]
MLSPIKKRTAKGKGLNTVFGGRELNNLALDLLVLGPGDTFTLETGEYEIAIVPLTGDAVFSSESGAYRLQRESVWKTPASALCIPRDSNAAIRAERYSEFAMCKARTDEKRAVFHVPSGREKTVGRDAWKRKVVDIIGQEEGASRIVLGETFNPPGGWSSFPPHKHDTEIPGQEARMEEIYLFRLDPASGFGTQTIYGDQGSHSFMVKDYDAVTIPWGYHPVSAMPGHSLYYLWFLAGEGRTLRPNTDPKFKWLEA